MGLLDFIQGVAQRIWRLVAPTNEDESTEAPTRFSEVGFSSSFLPAQQSAYDGTALVPTDQQPTSLPAPPQFGYVQGNNLLPPNFGPPQQYLPQPHQYRLDHSEAQQQTHSQRVQQKLYQQHLVWSPPQPQFVAADNVPKATSYPVVQNEPLVPAERPPAIVPPPIYEQPAVMVPPMQNVGHVTEEQQTKVASSSQSKEKPSGFGSALLQVGGRTTPIAQGVFTASKPAPAQRKSSFEESDPREIQWEDVSLDTLLGEGAFGKVYKAHITGFHKPVAVKVFGEGGVPSGFLEQIKKEFKHEVDTMAAVPPHQNILRLLAWSSSHLAIVTAMCERGSVYSILHGSDDLTWPVLLQMGLDACRGMQHLHSCKILHRDLKSANLLVDISGGVRVADFGLSRVITRQNTMTGQMGTYQWMAPEVLANQRYSEKADVYSMAIVLWETATRKIPYENMNGLQAATAVLTRGLRPELAAHIPQPLADLIKRCWDAIPAKRPQFEYIVQEMERLTSMADM